MKRDPELRSNQQHVPARADVEEKVRLEFFRFVEECRREIELRDTERDMDQDVLEVTELLMRRRQRAAAQNRGGSKV